MRWLTLNGGDGVSELGPEALHQCAIRRSYEIEALAWIGRQIEQLLVFGQAQIFVQRSASRIHDRKQSCAANIEVVISECAKARLEQRLAFPLRRNRQAYSADDSGGDVDLRRKSQILILRRSLLEDQQWDGQKLLIERALKRVPTHAVVFAEALAVIR